MKGFILITLTILCYSLLAQGPYAPPVGQNGSTALYKDSTVFVGWASNCTVTKGWQDISNTSLGLTSVGTNFDATDKSGINGVVSLGDGGSATLTFDGTIYNGTGADFAVFENGFGTFLELAFVEVSSDGINFFRFDAISLTDTIVQTGGFGSTDATDLYNLAGKYRAQYGTPFDLNELIGTPGLNVNKVSHIRIVDVVGNTTSTYATYDSQNRAINDPWPTPFASSGFDLDAVGVINFTPTAVEEQNKTISLSVYPNPAFNTVYFNFKEQANYSYRLSNISGKEISNGQLKNLLDISNLKAGIYFISIFSEDKFTVKKIIKQ
ncbi:MAG: T9SS type A sorting domain-containing protein [Flavobacteriales bacterium]|nr:T9SS type A sorting domain-containing protein [Flavobacteriales bacterium]